jgi:hypothetical protein
MILARFMLTSSSLSLTKSLKITKSNHVMNDPDPQMKSITIEVFSDYI